MRYRRWVFPLSLGILALYAALFLVDDERWIPFRRIALTAQFSIALSHVGAGLLVAAAIFLLTMLLGRGYCMILCPLGTLQEIFSRLGKKNRPASHTKSSRLANASRDPAIMALLALSLFITTCAVLVFNPISLAAFLAGIVETATAQRRFDSLALLTVCLVLPVALASWFKGRLFCRICPVGFILGVAADLGGKTAAIAPATCISCGKCETVCPTRSIDAKGKQIFGIRCLGCGECSRACPVDAITPAGVKQPDRRRSFLNTALAAGAGLLYATARPAAEYAGIASETPLITPPGTQGDTRHRNRCIACMACAVACPSRIIRPQTFGRPGLDMEYGFCHYNCHTCGDSCPAGVFEPMTLDEKQHTRIARTEFVEAWCVVTISGTECGACAEVCPTHAVRMRERDDGQPTIPDFDPDYCIGCGACKHVCPAPQRAFLVNGLARHEISSGVRPSPHGDASPAGDESHDPDEMIDFPF